MRNGSNPVYYGCHWIVLKYFSLMKVLLFSFISDNIAAPTGGLLSVLSGLMGSSGRYPMACLAVLIDSGGKFLRRSFLVSPS